MNESMLQNSSTEAVIGRLIEAIEQIVGTKYVLSGEAAADFGTGWSSLGSPVVLVRPANTAETAACVKACNAARMPIVPWGGRTGLAGGACADGAVALSLDRMNGIDTIDPVDGTMLVEAGCVIQNAADAAEAQGLFFPLDLGSRGSATIGGAISNNAGGNRALRFGMMRDLVLGVEAVLADGTVLSSLQPLIKNNTGYDLKQLFIGAEGTLGVVTRAVIRLRPAFHSRNAALIGVDSFARLARLLRFMEAHLGGQLSAFEAMWPDYYELVTTPPAKGRPILPHGHAFYALIEAMGGDQDADAQRFEAALTMAMEKGLIADAVIARSEADVAAMWAVRDDGEQVGRMGPYVALDVSLRLSLVADFVEALERLIGCEWPDTAKAIFGHVGDGNLHLVIASSGDPKRHDAITRGVLELVGQMGGSISAEHGIGTDKRDYLPMTRSQPEIDTMWLIKRALDPLNLMNPGKVLPAQDMDGGAAH